MLAPLQTLLSKRKHFIQTAYNEEMFSLSIKRETFLLFASC